MPSNLFSKQSAKLRPYIVISLLAFAFLSLTGAFLLFIMGFTIGGVSLTVASIGSFLWAPVVATWEKISPEDFIRSYQPFQGWLGRKSKVGKENSELN